MNFVEVEGIRLNLDNVISYNLLNSNIVEVYTVVEKFPIKFHPASETRALMIMELLDFYALTKGALK